MYVATLALLGTALLAVIGLLTNVLLRQGARMDQQDARLDRLTEAVGVIAELRGEIAALGSDLRGEMAGMRGELRGEIAELRAEVRVLGNKLDAHLQAHLA